MQFSVTTREGATHAIAAAEGLSLMQNIRNAGIEELQAICGGCLSCATCHVYIDDASARVQLAPKSRDEEDLLDASDHLEPNSRLACQLVFGPELAGLRVTIAPED